METLVAEIHSTDMDYSDGMPTYLTMPLTETAKLLMRKRVEKFDAEKLLDSDLSSSHYDIGDIKCYDGDYCDTRSYFIHEDFGTTDGEVEEIEILEFIIYGHGFGIVFRGCMSHSDTYWESDFIPVSVFEEAASF